METAPAETSAGTSDSSDSGATAAASASSDNGGGNRAQGDRQRGNGQGGGNNAANRQQRAEERMQRMKTELALTDDQATKIQAIYAERFGAMRQQQGGAEMSREERRAAFEKAREATNTEIAQILTPEQKTKFDAMAQERRNQRDQNGGQRNGGGGQRNGGGQ